MSYLASDNGMSVKNSSLMRFTGIHINRLQHPKSSSMSHNRYRSSRNHNINIVGGVFEVLNCTENGNQVHRFCDEILVERKVLGSPADSNVSGRGGSFDSLEIVASLRTFFLWFSVQHFHRRDPEIQNHVCRSVLSTLR